MTRCLGSSLHPSLPRWGGVVASQTCPRPRSPVPPESSLGAGDARSQRAEGAVLHVQHQSTERLTSLHVSTARPAPTGHRDLQR